MGKQIISEQVKARLESKGVKTTLNTQTNSILADIKGDNAIYRVAIGVQPDDETPMHIRLQSILIEPKIQEFNTSRYELLTWVNAKNHDLIYGRYYLHDDILVFETSLPVIDGTCDWKVFDFLLRLALFSFDDAIAQLKAVVES